MGRVDEAGIPQNDVWLVVVIAHLVIDTVVNNFVS